MAGLIANEMQEAEGMPPEMAMGANQGEPEVDESDPKFQEALALAMESLYSNEAAMDVSKQLKSAGDLTDALANVAYDITAVIDERTNGQVPDELLVPLAMKVLEEVVEIANASGLDPQPENVAMAFKQMVLRYLQEQGLDTSQLDQAMSQVDPSVFRQAAEENTEEV
jgi:hypothetical protein